MCKRGCICTVVQHEEEVRSRQDVYTDTPGQSNIAYLKAGFSAWSCHLSSDSLVKGHISVVCFCCHCNLRCFGNMGLVQFTNCTVLIRGSIKPGDVWVSLQRVFNNGFLNQLILFTHVPRFMKVKW